MFFLFPTLPDRVQTLRRTNGFTVCGYFHAVGKTGVLADPRLTRQCAGQPPETLLHSLFFTAAMGSDGGSKTHRLSHWYRKAARDKKKTNKRKHLQLVPPSPRGGSAQRLPDQLCSSLRDGPQNVGSHTTVEVSSTGG